MKVTSKPPDRNRRVLLPAELVDRLKRIARIEGYVTVQAMLQS